MEIKEQEQINNEFSQKQAQKLAQVQIKATQGENNINQSRSQFEKKQSMEIYPELKLQDSKKDSQLNDLTNSQQIKEYNKTNKIISLQTLEEQQQTPLLNMQKQAGQEPAKIKILSYNTTVFMGMKTQNFQIEIGLNTQNYSIQRRFSDFLDLYQQIFYNHPGYIIHPFPDKTLQSFIKLKLGLNVQAGQRNQLIQRRIDELQQFINWLASHQELRYSQQFKAFINKDEKVYQFNKVRLNKYVSQFKNLESGSQIKNFLVSGKQLLFSYFTNKINEKKRNNDQISKQFQTIFDSKQQSEIYKSIQIQKQKIKTIISQFQSLLVAQKSFSQLTWVNTQINILQKLMAKHASGKIFCQHFSVFLQVNVVQRLKLNERKLQEAQKSLIYCHEIISSLFEAQHNVDLQKKSKLERRLKRSRRNFLFDWHSFIQSYKQQISTVSLTFADQWSKFKLEMRKIWKNSNLP